MFDIWILVKVLNCKPSELNKETPIPHTSSRLIAVGQSKRQNVPLKGRKNIVLQVSQESNYSQCRYLDYQISSCYTRLTFLEMIVHLTCTRSLLHPSLTNHSPAPGHIRPVSRQSGSDLFPSLPSHISRYSLRNNILPSSLPPHIRL